MTSWNLTSILISCTKKVSKVYSVWGNWLSSMSTKLWRNSITKSVISFSIICWDGNLCIKDKNSLGKIIKVASKVIGTNMNSLGLLFSRHVLNKALSIHSDAAHPLNAEYKLPPLGLRLQTPSATRNRRTHCPLFLSLSAVWTLLWRSQGGASL